MNLTKKFNLSESKQFEIFKQAIAPCIEALNKQTATVCYFINMQIVNSTRKLGENVHIETSCSHDDDKTSLSYTIKGSFFNKGTIAHIERSLGTKSLVVRNTVQNGVNYLFFTFPNDTFSQDNINRDTETGKSIINKYNSYVRSEKESGFDYSIEHTDKGALVINNQANISFIVRKAPISGRDMETLVSGGFDEGMRFSDNSGFNYVLFQNNTDIENFLSLPESAKRYGDRHSLTVKTLIEGMNNNARKLFLQDIGGR